jgi:hypothetical protein
LNSLIGDILEKIGTIDTIDTRPQLSA